MPPSDDVFSTFLSQLPKQVCLDCLTEIYGENDANSVRARLSELGDALETVEAECGNCDQRSTVYRIRHH